MYMTWSHVKLLKVCYGAGTAEQETPEFFPTLYHVIDIASPDLIIL
jgi:hypothetical protein